MACEDNEGNGSNKMAVNEDKQMSKAFKGLSITNKVNAPYIRYRRLSKRKFELNDGEWDASSDNKDGSEILAMNNNDDKHPRKVAKQLSFTFSVGSTTSEEDEKRRASSDLQFSSLAKTKNR